MKKKGFTLIEIIIVIAIMGIVLGMVYSFMVFEYKSYAVTTEMIDTQERGRDILRLMSEGIKNAESITTSSTDKSGYTFVVTIKPYESDGSDKTWSYYIGNSNHNLYKFYNSSFTLISSNVKSVNIIYPDPGNDLYNISVVIYSNSSYSDTKIMTFTTSSKYIKRQGNI